MSRWQPASRADGTPIWVNASTGEVCDSLAELVTGRSWDAGLAGLVAAEELGHLEVEDQGQVLEVVVIEAFTRVSDHDHVGSMVFDGARCSCSSCGQGWVFGLDDRGDAWWVPQWYDGDGGQVVMLGRRKHHRPKV